MADRQVIIDSLEGRIIGGEMHHGGYIHVPQEEAEQILVMLKEQESLLGVCQTADGITFISTGTAQEGEKRGITLGKKLMHEWLYKELLYKDLLTDETRSVFEQAESI